MVKCQRKEMKKKEEKPKKKTGPKPTVTKADEEMLANIRKLAQAGCSKEEMRRYLKMSNDSFYSRLLKNPTIVELIEKEAVHINFLLRAKQIDMALKENNVPMLIHLGKHRLGQIEKTEVAGEVNVKQSLDKETISKIALAILNEQQGD